LLILMNRVNPALFSSIFTAWVRETWPDRPDFIALDGKTASMTAARVGRRSTWSRLWPQRRAPFTPSPSTP